MKTKSHSHILIYKQVLKRSLFELTYVKKRLCYLAIVSVAQFDPTSGLPSSKFVITIAMIMKYHVKIIKV